MKIIQASPAHTGSTVLANCLTEIFDKGKPIRCAYSHNRSQSQNIVTKTHNIDFDFWTNYIKEKYNKEDLFFFSTHRENHKKIKERYMRWDNVTIFDYEEILETETWSLSDICENIYAKVKIKIPRVREDCISDMISRIKAMNKVYESIKDKPFGFCDRYFHLHGSHRGREK